MSERSKLKEVKDLPVVNMKEKSLNLSACLPAFRIACGRFLDGFAVDHPSIIADKIERLTQKYLLQSHF